MKELVSVIVPVYNVQNYVDRCLKSIISQTYEDLEIIIIDDGSTDKSGEICNNYAEQDCRVTLVHKQNGGLSTARNTGLDLAIGKYVCFVDSDDWLEKDAIEHLFFLLKKYDADYVMAENSRTDKKCLNHIQEVVYSNKDFLNLILKAGTQKNVQYAWAKLYKKSLFEDVRYPVGLTAEDIPAIFELTLKSKKIIYSTKKIYNYSENPDSITGKKLNDTVFDLIRIWELVENISVRYQCEESIRKQIEICKKRNTLGILCNIAITNFDKEEIIFWENKSIVKALVKSLKKDKWTLLRSNIPISRKILTILFCFSFKRFSRLIRNFYVLVK